jgi:hypothetical protein
MRMDSAEARTSDRKTRPCRKAPLKPKNGLNGPPQHMNNILEFLNVQKHTQTRSMSVIDSMTMSAPMPE